MDATASCVTVIRAKRSKSDRQHTTNPRLHHHAAWRFALFFLAGNSSPFIGGLPTLARLRTFSAFGIPSSSKPRLVCFAFFFVLIIDLRVTAAQLPAGSPCGH